VSLDCRAIEFVVPNAPGGGSDQQAQFLKPGLEEFFGVPVNIVYRQGAGGAIAWLDLRDRDPDGCIVSNVVFPNLALSQEQDETGLLKADEFVHITQTWTAPQTIAVKIDETRWQTIQELLDFALANPGRVTVGGTGRNGAVFAKKILEATGASFTYVPMAGGVGDTIPLLAGGQIDVAFFASSHVENNKELIRGLVVAGSQRNPSPSLQDIPSFGEIGFPGVTMSTTFGVMAPPGLSPELTQLWSEAIAFAISAELLAELPTLGLTPLSPTPAEAQAFNRAVLADFGLS
jgi:tripartite-type tricarboxylate transporter receptor subunit TctC